MLPPAPLRPRVLALRLLVFTLAFLSFACLLGQFYGFWSMHAFGCAVLPPSSAMLAWLAWRGGPARAWIVNGTLGGIVAALAYDLYRLPFVLCGIPLFKVFPIFGALLLGKSGPQWLIEAVGWTYHFSNGAALGIMFLSFAIRPGPRFLFWGAVAWALFVEAVLLSTPYARFFGLPLNARFIFLTASAHLVFGVVLGLRLRRRLGRPETAGSLS